MLVARAERVSPSVVLMVVVVPLFVSVKLSAPSAWPVERVGEDQVVPVVGADVMEKSEAAPEELATMARREPEESVSTEAVTPRFALLMFEAKAVRLELPLLPMLNVVAPAEVVSVNEEFGSVAVALDERSEYHEAV